MIRVAAQLRGTRTMFAGIHIHGLSVMFAQGDELRSVGQWLISWWPYVAVPVGALFVLLALASATSRTTRSASWRSSGRGRARCPRARSSRSTAKPAFRPSCCAAACTSATGGGNTACHKVRLVTISQGKIGYVYARDGEPLLAEPDAWASASSATTFRTPARSSRATTMRTATHRPRPARPPARDPARRRLRHQPGAVRRDRRRPRVRAARDPLAAGAARRSSSIRDELAAIGGFDPVVIGAKMRIGRPARARTSRRWSTRSAS